MMLYGFKLIIFWLNFFYQEGCSSITISENSYYLLEEGSFKRNENYIKNSFEIKDSVYYKSIAEESLLRTDSLIVSFFNQKYANDYLSMKDYDIQLIPLFNKKGRVIYGIMFLRDDNVKINLCKKFTMPFGGSFSVIRLKIDENLHEYDY